MHLLLLDNYDSFTYNLMHYLAEEGAEVTVIRSDAISTKEVLAAGYDGIVISPGPGTPDESGICLELIKAAAGNVPILGVCLGHQAMAQAFGATLKRIAPMHGKISKINHTGKGVFTTLPSPFEATRYHSLVIDTASLPDCFEVIAHTDDDIIMGIEHREHNMHGVQFHPESIASEHGHAMIANFIRTLR